MFCRNCGNEIQDEWVKCPYCEELLKIQYREQNLRNRTHPRNKWKIFGIALLAIIILFFLMDEEADTPEENDLSTMNTHVSNVSNIEFMKDDNGDIITLEDINTYLCCQGEDTPFLITDIYANQSLDVAGYLDLSTEFTNQTGKNLRSVVVGIAAWDSNGLPIKLQVLYNFVEDDDYVLEMNVENITSDFSDSAYLQIENTDIGYINAVILEYEDFNGNWWKNPLTSYYKEMASVPVNDDTIAYKFNDIAE